MRLGGSALLFRSPSCLLFRILPLLFLPGVTSDLHVNLYCVFPFAFDSFLVFYSFLAFYTHLLVSLNLMVSCYFFPFLGFCHELVHCGSSSGSFATAIPLLDIVTTFLDFGKTDTVCSDCATTLPFTFLNAPSNFVLRILSRTRIVESASSLESSVSFFYEWVLF